MNEGYRLTDFTLEELSHLNWSINAALIQDSIPINVKESLREQQVRVLTAFSIVKEREKLNDN